MTSMTTLSEKKRGPGRPRIGRLPLTASEKMQRYRARLEQRWNAAADANTAAQMAAQDAECALDRRLDELAAHDKRMHAAGLAAAADQPHEPLAPLMAEHERLAAIVQEARATWREAAAQTRDAAKALFRAEAAKDRAA